jgi:hypothetical protein
VPADDITIRQIFALMYKFNLKELLPSDWLALASLNEIAPVEKALHGDTIFIMSDRWRGTSKKSK